MSNPGSYIEDVLLRKLLRHESQERFLRLEEFLVRQLRNIRGGRKVAGIYRSDVRLGQRGDDFASRALPVVGDAAMSVPEPLRNEMFLTMLNDDVMNGSLVAFSLGFLVRRSDVFKTEMLLDGIPESTVIREVRNDDHERAWMVFRPLQQIPRVIFGEIIAQHHAAVIEEHQIGADLDTADVRRHVDIQLDTEFFCINLGATLYLPLGGLAHRPHGVNPNGGLDAIEFTSLGLAPILDLGNIRGINLNLGVRQFHEFLQVLFAHFHGATPFGHRPGKSKNVTFPSAEQHSIANRTSFSTMV